MRQHHILIGSLNSCQLNIFFRQLSISSLYSIIFLALTWKANHSLSNSSVFVGYYNFKNSYYVYLKYLYQYQKIPFKIKLVTLFGHYILQKQWSRSDLDSGLLSENWHVVLKLLYICHFTTKWQNFKCILNIINEYVS